MKLIKRIICIIIALYIVIFTIVISTKIEANNVFDIVFNTVLILSCTFCALFYMYIAKKRFNN
jgi:hypothetical protein